MTVPDQRTLNKEIESYFKMFGKRHWGHGKEPVVSLTEDQLKVLMERWNELDRADHLTRGESLAWFVKYAKATQDAHEARIKSMEWGMKFAETVGKILAQKIVIHPDGTGGYGCMVGKHFSGAHDTEFHARLMAYQVIIESIRSALVDGPMPDLTDKGLFSMRYGREK